MANTEATNRTSEDLDSNLRPFLQVQVQVQVYYSQVLSGGSLTSLWALWLPSPIEPGSLTRSCELWVVMSLDGHLTGFFFPSGFYPTLVIDGMGMSVKINGIGFQ